MYRIKSVLVLCGLLMAVMVGCATSDRNQVKPPKGPEEFRAPPETDSRYSRPMEYPKDTMDRGGDDSKKSADPAKNTGKGGANVTGPARGF